MSEILEYVDTAEAQGDFLSLVEDPKTLPECNWETYLRGISRKIELRSILSTGVDWHITPMFSNKIAYRASFDGFDRIIHEGSDLIEFKASYVRKRLRPTPPPIIPSPYLKIAKHIKECGSAPYILYKPEEWSEIKCDPAIVVDFDLEWRVFAIWGDVIEQAEIMKVTYGVERFVEGI